MIIRLVEETLEEMNDSHIEINISKVRDQVFSILSESLRSPGEPTITFVISNIDSTSDDCVTTKE